MRDHIYERVQEVAKYTIRHRCTVRSAAKSFGVSKSTIHKDLTERLPKVDPCAATAVREILDNNKAVRHIRGGEATKRKWRGIK